MKVAIVLNRTAGTLRGLDADAVGRDLETIFRERGHAVSLDVGSGKGAVAAIERLCGKGEIDALIVGGGDGTVSAAAGAATGTGIALGILPAGTMNLVAKALAIPADLKAAAEALAEGVRDKIDVGQVNGRTFLHLVSIGIQPRVVAEREKLGYGSRLGKMIGGVRAFVRLMSRPRRYALSINADGVTLDRVVTAAVVSNNPLGAGHLPHAERLDGGILGVYLTEARGWSALARVAAAVATGQATESPLVESRTSEAVRIRLRERRPTLVTVDGELLHLSGILEIESVPGALTVLRPKAEEKA
jgi:diacylglycerol kinase family enzyme